MKTKKNDSLSLISPATATTACFSLMLSTYLNMSVTVQHNHLVKKQKYWLIFQICNSMTRSAASESAEHKVLHLWPVTHRALQPDIPGKAWRRWYLAWALSAGKKSALHSHGETLNKPWQETSKLLWCVSLRISYSCVFYSQTSLCKQNNCVVLYI